MQVGDIAVSFTSPLQSSFEDILLAVFILKVSIPDQGLMQCAYFSDEGNFNVFRREKSFI